VFSQKIPCFHASLHENVTVVKLVVSGYFQDDILNNSKDDFMLFISVNLTLSLESFAYHCIDINAIVHKIANIVMTTINSTKVKALFFLYIGI
jgi:hypothetical protein